MYCTVCKLSCVWGFLCKVRLGSRHETHPQRCFTASETRQLSALNQHLPIPLLMQLGYFQHLITAQSILPLFHIFHNDVTRKVSFFSAAQDNEQMLHWAQLKLPYDECRFLRGILRFSWACDAITVSLYNRCWLDWNAMIYNNQLTYCPSTFL